LSCSSSIDALASRLRASRHNIGIGPQLLSVPHRGASR
jgi:hypothetical protein